MRRFYEDILDLSDNEPEWFDEHGVPRFCAFAPDRIANIYADECCLLEISCQGCGHLFRVAVSWDRARSGRRLSERSPIEYGDPPNMQCCAAGPTMNSVSEAVLEFWTSNRDLVGWSRRPDLEGESEEA